MATLTGEVDGSAVVGLALDAASARHMFELFTIRGTSHGSGAASAAGLGFLVLRNKRSAGGAAPIAYGLRTGSPGLLINVSGSGSGYVHGVVGLSHATEPFVKLDRIAAAEPFVKLKATAIADIPRLIFQAVAATASDCSAEYYIDIPSGVIHQTLARSKARALVAAGSADSAASSSSPPEHESLGGDIKKAEELLRCAGGFVPVQNEPRTILDEDGVNWGAAYEPKRLVVAVEGDSGFAMEVEGPVWSKFIAKFASRVEDVAMLLQRCHPSIAHISDFLFQVGKFVPSDEKGKGSCPPVILRLTTTCRDVGSALNSTVFYLKGAVGVCNVVASGIRRINHVDSVHADAVSYPKLVYITSLLQLKEVVDLSRLTGSPVVLDVGPEVTAAFVHQIYQYLERLGEAEKDLIMDGKNMKLRRAQRAGLMWQDAPPTGLRYLLDDALAACVRGPLHRMVPVAAAAARNAQPPPPPAAGGSPQPAPPAAAASERAHPSAPSAAAGENQLPPPLLPPSAAARTPLSTTRG